MNALSPLHQRTIEQTQHATEKGELVPANVTVATTDEQRGIPFHIRINANLQRKDANRKQQSEQARVKGREPNPFLPYHPDMFVDNISATHVCLLNRFKLFAYPLLIVTREFEEQASFLTAQDFHAIGQCLQQMDGVAFYNGDLKSGASQRHKHFHFIPYPLDNAINALPIDHNINTLQNSADVFTLTELPYYHYLMSMDWSTDATLESLTDQLQVKYQILLQTLRQTYAETSGQNLAHTYNVIITRHWMKIILRSVPGYASIPLNALAFAGIICVRSEFHLNLVRKLRPMTVLQGLGVKR